AILKSGLEVTDPERFNAVLALAGFSPDVGAERTVMQAEKTVSPAIRPLGELPRLERPDVTVLTLVLRLACAVVLSVLLGIRSGHPSIVITTSAIYGSLYAVSLLLESAMDPRSVP